jgi:hypothetical protein
MEPASKITLAAVIICVICVSGVAEAVVLPKTARLLPPETVLLVDIDNFSRLKTQFEKTNLYELYKDPAVAAFVEDAKENWRKKIGQLDENDIFRTIFNADVLPQGRAALAFVLSEQTKDANEPPVVIITQWGDKIDKVNEAINKMLQKNIEMGGHQKRSEDYRGVNIQISIDEASQVLNHCFIDDCFIASTDLDLIKFIIAHIKGAASPTLAADADYNATFTATGPYHDVDFYANTKQIIKTTLAKDSTGQTQRWITNLGFDNVAAFGGSLGFARRPGSSCAGKAYLKVNGTKKGVLKMLQFESAVLKAPRFVPESTCSTTFLNLNIRNAYGELSNILNSFSPQAAALMYMPLPTSDSPDEPSLTIKDDIIDHLGSQIVITQSINKPFAKNSMPTETLFAVAASDSKALENSLSTLHSKFISANNPDAKRELLGHTIYLLNLSTMPFWAARVAPMQTPVESGTVQMPNLAFTFTDTHLIFGAESTVDRAIRTLSSTEAVSVSSARWFTSAKSAIEPSHVGLAYLEDTAASNEFLWWMMKQSAQSQRKDSSTSAGVSASSKSPLPHMLFSQVGVDLFNFALLPEFDTVRKYFGLSVFHGVTRSDGFFFEFNYLKPHPPAD